VREITMREAIREAIREEMLRDKTVLHWGELDYCGEGMFGVLGRLGQEFGPERVMDTPLSETAITGACVGAALGGYRPICEIMFADFAFVAADEILLKMAKWRYMHGGEGGMKLPIVVRMASGRYRGLAAEHSQMPLAYYVHTPGLKIVVPTSPYDAKGLLKTAIRDNNPVIFFEHKLLYGVSGPVPEEEYTVPFGVADVNPEGSDVTVVAIGLMVKMARDVARELAKEGISVEVIDPRTLEPLDSASILRSVEKTGRVVLVDEDVERAGTMAEIGFQIQESAFHKLKAPIRRVCAANVPIPYSKPLEEAVLPQPKDIEQAIRAVVTG